MGFEITRGVELKPQKVVVYGPEGVGKTTLAAKFPSPLFIDTEGGSGHLDVPRLPAPIAWQDLLDEVKWVRDYPWECGGTLVLDTADWAELLCTRHVCGKAGKDGIEDFGYGKGYVYVKEEFGKLLNLLGECVERGLNVVVTAHAAIVKFEQPDEMGAYDRWEMKLSRKHVAPLLKEWADAVLFANFKTIVVESDKAGKRHKAMGGRNRVLHASHSATWDAKNRWGLPDEVPMDFAQIAPHIPVPDVRDTSAPLTDAEAADARSIQAPFDAPGRPAHIKPLLDLMSRDGVSEGQLQDAMAARGYFPAGTPIDVYDEQTAAWVASAWAQIREFINAGMPA